MLKREGVTISMDGRGRAFDNIFVERLWRSVKHEDVYLNGYATMGELLTDRRFNHMEPSIAPWKRPQPTLNTRFPTPCARFWQIHRQGLVFRSVVCGTRRVPGAEPSRSESKSPLCSVTN